MTEKKKRIRSGLTDDDILARLRAGNLVVNTQTSQVFSFSENTRRWSQLREYEDKHNSGYRFIQVCWNGKRKKISCHRLVWLQHTLTPIPPGFEVDHIKSPPRPEKKDNSITNLQLLTKQENNAKGQPDF